MTSASADSIIGRDEAVLRLLGYYHTPLRRPIDTSSATPGPG